jgi:hypothetical protein
MVRDFFEGHTKSLLEGLEKIHPKDENRIFCRTRTVKDIILRTHIGKDSFQGHLQTESLVTTRTVSDLLKDTFRVFSKDEDGKIRALRTPERSSGKKL